MERRRHPRIRLKAYGMHHLCVVRDLPFAVDARSRAGVEVILIDISPGGARLRCNDPVTLEYITAGMSLALDHCFPAQKHFPERIGGVVRWRAGDEFGVKFNTELSIGVSDLQRFLDQ